MNWHELALNPDAVTQLFSLPPPLEEVEVVELLAHRDGPRVQFKINLSAMPDHPPERWIRQGFNALQLQLDFFDIRELRINGWSRSNKANVQIESGANNSVRLRIDGASISVVVTSGFFRIARLSGYQRDLSTT